jgi:hypothetical protein
MSLPRISGSVVGFSVAFLLLSGCFSKNLGIRDQWPQPDRSANPCRDIAGTYVNLGEASAEVQWRPNLVDALTVRAHIANEVASHLHMESSLKVMATCTMCVTELQWLDSELRELRLTVRMTNDGQNIARTLSAPKGDFLCSKAGLEVSYFLVYERVWSATYLRGSRVFAVAPDGSLMMTETATSFLRIAAILPLVTDSTFSARWVPYR